MGGKPLLCFPSMEIVKFTKENLIELIKTSHQTLDDFVSKLSDEQIIQPLNEENWVVKDYLIHLATWQNGITYLLQKMDRGEGMGLTKEIVENWELKTINSYIYNQHQNISFEEARAMLTTGNAAMLKALDALDLEDLMKPYNAYDPRVPFEDPVVQWVNGNTHGHFNQHLETLKQRFAL